jgi:pimeloyl-ACP methyl ester carboxylesterase
LLHGFPASSYQYRNLIPALADTFHVIAMDYPGFGNSDMPDPTHYPYTFDKTSEVVESFLQKKDFTRFGLFMQDYGGPVGFRILSRHPDWLQWLIIQNTNAYEVGFTAAWEGFRNALRKRRTLYRQWQAFLRSHQPKTIIFWGQDDIFFTREGGDAYLNDMYAQRRDASTRFGSLRGGGLPGVHRQKHPSLLRRDGGHQVVRSGRGVSWRPRATGVAVRRRCREDDAGGQGVLAP